MLVLSLLSPAIEVPLSKLETLNDQTSEWGCGQVSVSVGHMWALKCKVSWLNKSYKIGKIELYLTLRGSWNRAKLHCIMKCVLLHSVLHWKLRPAALWRSWTARSQWQGDGCPAVCLWWKTVACAELVSLEPLTGDVMTARVRVCTEGYRR